MKNKINSFFPSLSQELAEPFALYCAQRNGNRFSVLPAFNILTQVACFFIYLYIYPITFPEKPRLDPTFFSTFSVAYIVVNAVFMTRFIRLQKNSEKPDYSQRVQRLLVVFLTFYVISESFETILEVEISGNIYRFLATFFMVAFLPILPRVQKFLLLFLYTGVVEGGFVLLISRGYAQNNHFQEIVLVFFLACLMVSNLTYNTTMRTFMLQHNLQTLNQELQKANERLEYLAVVDPLTGISNRRAFDQYMALAWHLAYQDSRPLTVMMIDVDDFKAYNDTYGHQQGDDCLQAVAGCIKGFLQSETDMVARYGGEEFIVLIVRDNPEKIHQLALRIQQGVTHLALEHSSAGTGLGCVTISLGLATVVPGGRQRYEDLIKQADDALYRAKTDGKNRVCVFGENAME